MLFNVIFYFLCVLQISDKCYKDNGVHYRGQATTTKTGKTCANWNYNTEFPINLPAFNDMLGL